jgi:uncharacterized protein involved in type VI secretion and phage assembly
MAYTIYDSAEEKRTKKSGRTSIEPGTVKSHCDVLKQGKELVHLPSSGMDVWARVGQVGAGDNRGWVWAYQPGDEVLVAYNAEDPRDAYILMGLHSTKNQMPVTSPTDTITKRTMRTGLTPLLGHKMEFDDAVQSITLTAAFQQTITLGPANITIEAPPSMKIVVGAQASGTTIEITDGVNSIQMGPTGLSLSSKLPITIKSDTAVVIQGTTVNIGRQVNLGV